jgi:hypothetical protein
MAKASLMRELRAILQFLSSLWGLLAGVSAVFPLANAVKRAIPLPAKGEDALLLTVEPATVLASLASLFALLFVVGMRRDPHHLSERGPKLALASFTLGAGAIATYLYTYGLIRLSQVGPSLSQELVGVGSYVFFYLCMTTAFSLLGMREYLHEEVARPQVPPRRAGR